MDKELDSASVSDPFHTTSENASNVFRPHYVHTTFTGNLGFAFGKKSGRKIT